MNISTVTGFVLAIAVFLHSVMTATDNRAIFMNEHGIIIVIGGTFAAGAICFPIGKILKLGTIALRRMFSGVHVNYPKMIHSIIDLGEKARADSTYLKTEVDNLKFEHPFLKECILMVNDGFTEDQIRELMELRIETHYNRYKVEASIFKTLSKFPPAFGLLGTTLGMIALLQKLGGEGASKQIGSSMAIGLVATLYGISLSNLLLIPIGENLSEANREDATMRKLILEGVLMIKSKMHPMMIAEKLNSYLIPSERITRSEAQMEEARVPKAAKG